MNFTKMHGHGNDYVYVDCQQEDVADPVGLAQIISDRHTGIGSDGLILIMPSQQADARMRIFNADGSEAEMCGNGLRCVAKYVYEHGLAQSSETFTVPGQTPEYEASLKIETGNGVLTVGLSLEHGEVVSVCVNMGQPILKPGSIPVLLEGDKLVNYPLQLAHTELAMTCVSMGNPHAVFFAEDLAKIDLEKLGPEIETHAVFPQRTNVHFVEVLSPQELRVKTWERGSGVTLACGTGACACCVGAVLTERANRSCVAQLPGGALSLLWNEVDSNVYMTGPAVEVFSGIWPDRSSPSIKKHC
jgi:diaminopimelate epimerase